MATLESIQAKIAKLQAQAETLAVTKSTAVLEKIRDLMHKHGLSLGDIEAHAGKRRGRKPGTVAAKKGTPAAKYQDPKSGATWSGYGRAPGWIVNAKDRTKFLIDAGSARARSVAPVTKAATKAAKPAVKPVAKPAAAKKGGNYARGPQPALYRDPASGATWSGRGPAPAWLSGAKDRTKFLIAKPETAAANTVAKSATAAAPAKKAAAKKAVAKKAVAKKVVARKAVAAKAVEKKVVAEKAVAEKAAVKKVAAKKVAAKKPAAKKVAAKKSPAPKKVAVKAPVEAAPAAPVVEAPVVAETSVATPAA